MAGKLDKNPYSFYETPSWIAKLLARNLNINQRSQILDIGAGRGALVQAVKDLYPKVICDAIEIDERHYNELGRKAENIYGIDLISDVIPKEIKRKFKKLSVISNPPFGSLTLNEYQKKLLTELNFFDLQSKSKNSRLEILFIARAIEFSESKTELGFIIPVTLLEAEQFKYFRECITRQHYLHKIILLPECSFQSTEVDSAIILLKVNAGQAETIIIEKCSTNKIESVRSVTPNSYLNTNRSKWQGAKSSTIGDLAEDIFRGRSCSKDLKEKNISYLHSSHVRNMHASYISINEGNNQIRHNEKVANEGDILIARVGTRCLGSIAMIKNGSAVISDSIISLRLPQGLRKSAFEKLVSPEGQHWLKQASRGSCAKILTHQTILNFPLDAL